MSKTPPPVSVILPLQGETTTPWNADHCVGSDRAAIHLRAEHLEQLAFVRREAGFRHLRCHGLFNDEMELFPPGASGTEAPRWAKIDRFLDQLVSLGITPFLEVGDMPSALGRHDHSIFHWKWRHSPPRDLMAWALLVERFTRHITERYGRETVRTWLFEVWNEPNLDGFWSGTQEEYFAFYQATVGAITQVDNQYQVGGPSTAGLAWIPEFLTFCREKSVPVHFVSTHHYGCDEGFLDLDGTSKMRLLWQPFEFSGAIKKAREEILASSYPSLPLYITEWGPSYSCRDPFHDSYLCPSWILEQIRETQGWATSMSYWAFSDLFEENGPGPGPFHGGFGLLNSSGIPKPAFYAYQFLHRLGDQWIKTGNDRVLLSRNGAGYRILAWDWTIRVQDRPNSEFFTRVHPSVLSTNLRLVLEGLPPGKWRVRSTRVGREFRDPQTLWLKSGEAVAEFRDASPGEPDTDETIDSLHLKTLDVQLRQNDLVLLELDPQ